MQPNAKRLFVQAWNTLTHGQADVLGPAFMACMGAAAFFAMPFEPTALPGLALALVAVGFAAWVWGQKPEWAAPATALLVGALFWNLAFVQLQGLESVPYARTERHPVWAVGVLERATPKPDNPGRVVAVLNPARLYGLAGSEDTRTLHIGMPAWALSGTTVGEGVATLVTLFPPEGPHARGQRDGRWYRFFHREVAYGYSVGRAEPTSLPPELTRTGGVAARILAVVEGWRNTVKTATQTLAGGTVAALLMGDQSTVTPALTQAYRATGLTHLLAISGMQLTLVGGGLFVLVRWLAAWWPALALRVEMKLPAALVGLAGAALYTLMAGGGVSVVRAFVMSALFLLAAALGRLHHALRGLGFAVLLILAFNPAMVLNAGFQLSVAAVYGLLAFVPPPNPAHSRVHAFAQSLMLATLAAGAATAPLLVLNFGQVSLLNIPANLLAVPLMGLATYAGFVALLLWPLGLQGVALWPMAKLCALVNGLASAFAGVSGPLVVLAGPQLWAVLAVVSGGSVFILAGLARQKTLAVLAGVGGTLAVAVGIGLAQTPADMRVLNGGATAFERTPEGPYQLAWSDAPAQALKEARRWGVPLAAVPPAVSPVPDLALLPPATGPYAWAEKRGNRWLIEPLGCGRMWQNADPRCVETVLP